ncbi:MAG: hypothetical protein GXX96_32225 [Planctomycetaceae bacterium]|nr:hypothetical protein [Planctomycetaceae bacterium]
MSHLPSTFRLPLLLLPLILLIGSSQPLYAHRPVFTEDAAKSPDTAIPLTEPHVSQVVYREITDKAPQIWLTFDVPEDFELYIQLGVPVIDRLEKSRPAMAVVGPGLPSEKVPFEIPESTGAKIFTTKEVEKPRFFNEHFTSTQSWILRSETIPLKEPGRYYLVAYSPDKQNGKFWLSIGKQESFKAEHWKQFPTWQKLIHKFHELK